MCLASWSLAVTPSPKVSHDGRAESGGAEATRANSEAKGKEAESRRGVGLVWEDQHRPGLLGWATNLSSIHYEYDYGSQMNRGVVSARHSAVLRPPAATGLRWLDGDQAGGPGEAWVAAAIFLLSLSLNSRWRCDVGGFEQPPWRRQKLPGAFDGQKRKVWAYPGRLTREERIL